ncbi:MAG TPA: YbaB/EbfC family nucleoid-associated protein [Actinophytocola sp.]|uniref:YbaB/EbfC family nucleoid-associated protein n=1 Tax=Actinophytocola sp. TaxID=1872138 RepID=UPI002F91CDA1
MASPDEWLADFTAKLDAIEARAAELEHDPNAPAITETSGDGALSVSVAPTGALSALRIDDSAWRGSGAELAERILELARAARRAAAVQVAETLGADAGAVSLIDPLPRAGEIETGTETDDDDFADERIFGSGNER